MASGPSREPKATSDADPPGRPTLKLVLNSNLGLPVDEEPRSVILPAAGIVAEPTTGLESIARALAGLEADVASIPIADFHRVGGRGGPHYHGLAIAISEFTGQPNRSSLLVVGRDDPADGRPRPPDPAPWELRG